MTAYSVSGAQRAVHLGKSREEAAHVDVCPQAWERQMGDSLFVPLWLHQEKFLSTDFLQSSLKSRLWPYPMTDMEQKSHFIHMLT